MLASVSVAFSPAMVASAGGYTPSGSAVIGIQEQPATLNPIIGPAMTYTGIVDGPMMPNLFDLAQNGTLVPDLATVVPTLQNGGISKNGLTYTFHLRPNVKWSDGVPFTSQDMIETAKLMQNPHVNAVTTEGFTDIKSMSAPNKLTVVTTLYKPLASYLSTCWSNFNISIIPAHVFDTVPPSQVNYFQYNEDPVPTLGPYKFVSWTHDASIVEVANPLYWGPKPHIKKLVFQIIPDQNTLLSALQAGNINLYFGVPITQLSTVKAISGVKLYEYNQPDWEWAQLNLKNPILANVDVRRALEYAIDRSAIVKYVLKGHGTLIADSQVPGYWSYDPAIKPYPYSPTMADKLLNEAGWKMGPGGIRVKDGKQLVLTYSTTSGNVPRAETEQIIQQNLLQVGIKLNIQNYPASTFFGTILYHGQFQIAEYEAGGAADPDLRTWRADSCQAFPPDGSNYGFWCNQTVSKLLTEEESTMDITARKAIFNQIAQIEASQMPSLYYFAAQGVDATRGMNGYTPNPFVMNTFQAYNWTLSK